MITNSSVANTIIDWLVLPSGINEFVCKPWTLLTYMITHYDVWHVLFNMLTLYWMGTLFMYRCTPRQFMGLYIIGGLAGGIFYLAAAQVFPSLAGSLLGASASVIALVRATAVIMPDHEIGLLLIGMVKLKYVAIVAIVAFALGLVGNNPGGHVAHIGGMFAGLAFGMLYIRGVDITSPLNRSIDGIVNLFNREGKPKKRKFNFKKAHKNAPKQENNTNAVDEKEQAREELDRILDKIRKSGYTSLTADEKKRLFDTSSKL